MQSAVYRYLRISAPSCSSRLISRFAMSLENSFAASYWLRYLASDLTPIFHASVMMSAIEESESSAIRVMLVFIHDIPLAIGLGDLPSS